MAPIGVAVIAVLERDDALARLADVAPVAERHLQRDLDRVEPLSEKKTCASPGGAIVEQAAREPLGRLVREAGEDHLVEPVRLRLDRRDDARMAVAVRDDPPRRDGVEDAAAVARLRARRLRRAAISIISGCSACCVKDARPGWRPRAVMSDVRRESPRGGSCGRRPRAASAASSGSRCGRRPRRRTPPISAMVRSESACSLADEGDAEQRNAAPLQGLDRQQAVVDGAEPRAGAQDDRHAPAGEQVDLQEVAGSAAPAGRRRLR